MHNLFNTLIGIYLKNPLILPFNCLPSSTSTGKRLLRECHFKNPCFFSEKEKNRKKNECSLKMSKTSWHRVTLLLSKKVNIAFCTFFVWNEKNYKHSKTSSCDNLRSIILLWFVAYSDVSNNRTGAAIHFQKTIIPVRSY